MFKDNRYINAGTTEVYRYGRKAVEKVSRFLEPNENGFYGIPVDGGKYWTIGTSKGKYGEFAKVDDTFFSVNSRGMMWAKKGSDKEQKFIDFVNGMIEYMHQLNAERVANLGSDDDDEE